MIWTVALIQNLNEIDIADVSTYLSGFKVGDPKKAKTANLLTSIFIGSINDLERVVPGVPDNLLDKN